jgi:N utilization substance protein B
MGGTRKKRLFEMVTRRQSREWALQMLVQFDLNPPEALDAAIADFWEQQAQLESDALAAGGRGARVIFTSDNPREQASLATARAFAEERVRGAWLARDELDAALEPYLENWPLYRLGTVERAVLRLAAWELRNCADIPAPIVVNEAVDLAKWFSESKSGRFVNGVVDRFAKAVCAAQKEDASQEETFTP